jgi:anti-anti-sigma factor
MRKCGKCGKRTDESAKYCPNCGESLPQVKEEGDEREIDEEALHIETEIREGPPRTAIVTMDGTVEAKDARLLRTMFHEFDEKKVKRVILDLKDVVYMSSAALGLLVSYASEKKQKEGSHCVYLVDISQAVGGAMSVLGLLAFFAIFPNLESALDTLGFSSPGTQ